ncbi:heavy metal translocating P-type ATPase [Haloparvum sedimenti]|uniref:heavy metal translocating P-type ATPase n=1 Tax=Haloparvum sedimenti TaxID=1678448 RepID=UPI0009B5A751|nr:heavy metal translocating P-type ATPase [Haloparvum sedimenti]
MSDTSGPDDAASGGPGEGATLRLSVPDMDCPSCAGKVERSVRGLDGVREVDPRPTSGVLIVRYDSDRTTPAAVTGRVEAAGYEVVDERTMRLSVPDMDCASCASKVASALDRPGVTDAETNPTAGEVTVTYDPETVDEADLVAAVESAGYEVVEAGENAGSAGGTASATAAFRTRRGVATGIGAVLLAAGLALEWAVPGANPQFATVGPWTITGAWVAYVLAVAAAGPPILRNGYYSAKTLSLDIDLLMSAGMAGALAIDAPFEAATLAVLFSTAELLERFSVDRARNSLSALMELSPDTATVLREGTAGEGGETEETVPAEAVAVGERVAVRPGEKVPLDGVVVAGETAVDESPITGESVPADKEPGDEVYAGSINEAGYVEVEVTATADDSTIARVVDLVESATAEDTEAERFVDRFAGVYTPLIVGLAVLTVVGGTLVGGGGFTQWFVRGLALLVIACPCAFVISTPVSVVSGVTAAARNGVLIKGGRHLENAGGVETVAVDKTGTLTTGELSVTDVVPVGHADEADVLSCAAALERRSEHPIGNAVVARAEEAGLPDREVTGFEALTGKGVRAEVDGETHYAGKPALFADLGFDLEHAHLRADGGSMLDEEDPLEGETAACDHEAGAYVDLINETIPRLQKEGKTVVLVGTESEIEGVVAVADTVRPEAAWAVGRLHELGIGRVVMLTGDNERTARAIGERVGVDEVRADLLPDEKVDAVRELREASDGGVLMVGDGVNDAPALAAATVGVAMGAAGTDAALETADAALMGDDLTRLPYLVDLSARASRVIRTNIAASLGVKALLALGAPFGYVTIAMAVLVGDMGMSLGVTGNALRLGRVEPAEPPADAVAKR